MYLATFGLLSFVFTIGHLTLAAFSLYKLKLQYFIMLTTDTHTGNRMSTSTDLPLEYPERVQESTSCHVPVSVHSIEVIINIVTVFEPRKQLDISTIRERNLTIIK